MTAEDAKRFREGLYDTSSLCQWRPGVLPDLWKEFFGREDIKGILRNAIYASCLQGRHKIEDQIKDLADAIFEYTIVDYNWIPEELDHDTPEAFLDYFKKTVRNLLTNRTFMREHFYVDLIVKKEKRVEGTEEKVKRIVKENDRKVAIDETPEQGRPLADTIPSRNEDRRADFKESLDIFNSIVKKVEAKYPKHGELLRRHYLLQENLRVTAKDYLRRGLVSVKGKKWCEEGLWTEEILGSALKNLQNSLLPKAREKFDAIAFHMDFDYRFGKK